MSALPEPAARVPAANEPAVDVAGTPAVDPAANDGAAPERRSNPRNAVRTTVDELVQLMAEQHDLRQDLIARGIPFQTINVMVEMGFNDRPEEQRQMVETALSASESALGQGAIERGALRATLEALVDFERDIAHTRRMAKQRGLDTHSLNFLANLVRHHPGDHGEKAINTFVAYAIACDIPLARALPMADAITEVSDSVLPRIDRSAFLRDGDGLRRLGREIAAGLGLAVALLWLFAG